MGTTEGDVLSGDSQIVAGFDGDDILSGNSSNDTLSGGTGDDSLLGGRYNDTYVFNPGDGHDVIYDDYTTSRQYNAGYDTLKFGDGITQDDLVFHMEGDDMVVNFQNNPADMVTIKDWANSNNRIEAIKFYDQSTLDFSSVTPSFVTTNNADTVTFSDGPVFIHSLDGDDNVTTGAYNDTLAGDTGADTLSAGNGNDTYVFNPDDGHDLIQDSGGTDTLRFGEGVTQDDLIFTTDGDDVVITFENSPDDSIRIQDWLNANNHIEQIKFFDGATFDFEDIMGEPNPDDTLYGGPGDDSLSGEEGNDTIYGEAGNDTLNGGDGDDSLSGGGDDDYLSGGDGNDELSGDLGNDSLLGGDDNDTYMFNLGGGHDVIQDSAGADTLEFGEGVIADALTFTLDGADMVVTIDNNPDDSVRITDWTDVNNRIETIKFSDDTTLTFGIDSVQIMGTEDADDLNLSSSVAFSMNIDGAGGDDTITLGNSANTLLGGAGNDSLSTGQGHDVLAGGTGADTLSAGNGNDTLDGGSGDDSLLGGDGDDSLSGGGDDDFLSGGEGLDTLNLGHDGYQDKIYFYDPSDENNLIQGFDSDDDLIQLEKGSSEFNFSDTGSLDTMENAFVDLTENSGSGYDGFSGAPSTNPCMIYYQYDNGTQGDTSDDVQQLYYDSNGLDAGGESLITDFEQGADVDLEAQDIEVVDHV